MTLTDTGEDGDPEVRSGEETYRIGLGVWRVWYDRETNEFN